MITTKNRATFNMQQRQHYFKQGEKCELFEFIVFYIQYLV